MLKEIRIKQNLTQRQVSELCNISISFYNQIENKKRKPAVSLAKQLGSILQFDWTLLYEDS